MLCQLTLVAGACLILAPCSLGTVSRKPVKLGSPTSVVSTGTDCDGWNLGSPSIMWGVTSARSIVVSTALGQPSSSPMPRIHSLLLRRLAFQVQPHPPPKFWLLCIGIVDRIGGRPASLASRFFVNSHHVHGILSHSRAHA